MRRIPFRLLTGLLSLFFFGLICPSGTALAASDSYYAKETFSIAPGGLVVVEAAFQNVEVYPTTEPAIEVEVKMEITAHSKQSVQRIMDEYKPVFTVSENLLRIRATPDKYINFYGPQRCAGSIKLTVPAEIDLEIKTTSGDSFFHNIYAQNITTAATSGDISFRGTVQNLTANTASGEIYLEGKVEYLTAETASGEIEAKLARPALFIEAKSASGDIRINGPVAQGEIHSISGQIEIRGLEGGRINASTVSGALSLHCSSITEKTYLSAESVSGSIRFSLPAGAKLKGEIETKTGWIEADFPGRFARQRKTFFLEDQDAQGQIYASTTSGPIFLRSGEARSSVLPKSGREEDETLAGGAKPEPPDAPPVAILNLYAYEKMLTPGLKYRLGADVYATGNIEYSYREGDLKLQVGAVYFFPQRPSFLSFYWGGGAQFTTKKGFQCPYIMTGANFFFLFTELVYPWELDLAPQSRFGLKINF